jgi:uncharacterized protein YycO
MPEIGAYGVITSNGFLARLIQLATFSKFNHCFIYIGNGQIVEADLNGVRIAHAEKYPNIAWNKHEVLTDAQREVIYRTALSLVGQPYNYIEIGNLLLRILGLKILSDGIVGKWANGKGYICSELVTECYNKAGVDTGKIPALTTPADLANRLIYL